MHFPEGKWITFIKICYWGSNYQCSSISSHNGLAPTMWHAIIWTNGPLARYVKLRVRMRRECRERFPRHRRWAIPTCITARASRTCRDACRDRQLAVSFEIGGGGKRSRHSRRMRNLQFYVSGKRPMVVSLLTHICVIRSQWVKWILTCNICYKTYQYTFYLTD